MFVARRLSRHLRCNSCSTPTKHYPALSSRLSCWPEQDDSEVWGEQTISIPLNVYHTLVERVRWGSTQLAHRTSPDHSFNASRRRAGSSSIPITTLRIPRETSARRFAIGSAQHTRTTEQQSLPLAPTRTFPSQPSRSNTATSIPHCRFDISFGASSTSASFVPACVVGCECACGRY